MAPTDFNGKWKLEKQELFDEYLTKIGLNVFKRKMAVNMSPTQEVTIDGDNVFIKNSLGADVKFTIGQAFEHESPTGEKFQAEGYWEGDKLVTKATVKNEDHITYREITDGSFLMTIHFGDLICKRYFKRC